MTREHCTGTCMRGSPGFVSGLYPGRLRGRLPGQPDPPGQPAWRRRVMGPSQGWGAYRRGIRVTGWQRCLLAAPLWLQCALGHVSCRLGVADVGAGHVSRQRTLVAQAVGVVSAPGLGATFRPRVRTRRRAPCRPADFGAGSCGRSLCSRLPGTLAFLWCRGLATGKS